MAGGEEPRAGHVLSSFATSVEEGSPPPSTLPPGACLRVVPRFEAAPWYRELRMHIPVKILVLTLMTWSTAPLPAQGAEKPDRGKKAEALPPPRPLGKAATEAMVARYRTSEHWLQKAVILLSLNHYWHPAGSAMVLEAVQDKDKRLRAYGVEALLRAEDGLLPTVVSKELLNELIDKQLSQSNKHYQGRVLEALKKTAPEAGADSKADWRKWWRSAREAYAPKEWKPKPEPGEGDGKNTVSFVERAFDLYTAGLDLCLCIDTTGSMQPSIDAVCNALDQMVDMLHGISPKFRLGLVHYKEIGDFGDADKTGARVISALNNNVKAVRKKLVKIKAIGGGDTPEQVANGLAAAYDFKRMKWDPAANKVVILIGDAPAKNVDAAKERAGKALKDPKSAGPGPITGAQAVGVRPFLTSAIGVLLDVRDNRIRVPPEFKESQEKMQKHFAAIADAGGGIYVELRFDVTVNKRGQVAPTNADKGDQAGRKMVEHILVLSFGKRYVREMRALVKIYYDYKGARWFR